MEEKDMAGGKNKESVNVAARVNMLLTAKGMKVSELAREMGRTPQSLAHLLKRNDPTTSQMAELAKALDTDIQMLLTPVTAEEYGRLMLDNL